MTISVLVVDDDDAVRQTLSIVLREEGYAVDEAPDGAAALDILRASPQCWVVLLDLRMPHMDGPQMLEAVAADPELADRHTYILLSASTTAHQLAPGVSRLVAERCVGALDKPFEVEDLLALVRHAGRALA